MWSWEITVAGRGPHRIYIPVLDHGVDWGGMMPVNQVASKRRGTMNIYKYVYIMWTKTGGSVLAFLVLFTLEWLVHQFWTQLDFLFPRTRSKNSTPTKSQWNIHLDTEIPTQKEEFVSKSTFLRELVVTGGGVLKTSSLKNFGEICFLNG